MESTQVDGTIGPCRNAQEYVVEYLKSIEGTASPSEIAAEYGCTPGHMQDVLRESGDTERVEIGEYELSTETEGTGGDMDESVESGDKASPSASDKDREIDGPSVDGPALSEVTGGVAGDLENGSDSMPTDEEYARLHSGTDERSDEENDEIEVDADGDRDLDESDDDSIAVGGVGAEIVETDESTPLPSIPVEAVVVLVVIVIAVWWVMRKMSSDGEEETESQDQSLDRGLIPGGN